MLSEDKKLELEINGFSVIRNLLTESQVAELNAVADSKEPSNLEAKEQQREFFICRWGKSYLDLMSHEVVMPYMEHLCGPKFRLDHDYCIFMNPGSPAGRLHGGEKGFSDFWYKKEHGQVQSGLTVVMYFLNDVGPGDGGFVAIPGSHRGNFLYDLPEDVLYQRELPDYIVQPTFKAGDAVVFMEGLIHGTGAWNGDVQRRVLLYKYCPGHICWGGDFYQASEFENITQVQKNLMRAPYVEVIKHPNGFYRTDTLEK